MGISHSFICPSVRLLHSEMVNFDSISVLHLAEPIIKPVANKKFFHAEQDLPITNYDVEYVYTLQLCQCICTFVCLVIHVHSHRSQ